MSGEKGVSTEHASKLHYLLVLLFLSWLLVACQASADEQEPNLDLSLYPKLELNMAPLLVQEVCATISDKHGFDIEESEPTSYVKQIEASIAQLKSRTTIPQTTIASLEAYLDAMAKLENEGRLHTVVGQDYSPTNYALSIPFSEKVADCSITTLNANPQSEAEQTGSAFHEGVHAVLFAQETEAEVLLESDQEEALAQYYTDLVTYGARLAGETDLSVTDRMVNDGIDMPATVVYLAENNYTYNHPLLRYLRSRKYVRWWTGFLKTWEKTLGKYQNLDNPSDTEAAQQEVDRLRSQIASYEEPWNGFDWTEQDIRIMQELQQKFFVVPGFFNP